MKKYLIILLLGLSPLIAQQKGKGKKQALQNWEYVVSRISAMPVESLSTKEIEAILYVREEEKLARDVYLALYEKWKFNIFTNIAESEERHFNIMKILINKYQLEDPVKKDSVGIFTNKELAKLYSDLVSRGTKSFKDALTVGALIEELDIYDLTRRMEESDNEDIKLAFTYLIQGSKNHIRAFISVIKRYGGEYKPVYLSKSELDRILNENEGKGPGRGKGKRMYKSMN